MKENSKEVLISVRNLTKSFNNKTVLSDINIDIYEKEIFGLIGVSGAGKTTLLEVIIGFLKPDKGDILFKTGQVIDLGGREGDFTSVLKEYNQIKRMVGYATQTPSFYDELTVEENLIYFGSLYNLSDEVIKRNIKTSLELVNLADQRDILAGNLSGGMQKRFDIACALIHNPKILILDEPTADLDVLLRRQMWDLVKKINEKGTTVIIASHFLDEIENLCDRIAVVNNKVILYHGEVDLLKKAYSKSEEVHIESIPGNYEIMLRQLREKRIPITQAIKRGSTLVIQSPEPQKILSELLMIIGKTNEKLIDFNLEKPTLEEVFEALTKKFYYDKIKQGTGIIEES